jgi:FdrA protein
MVALGALARDAATEAVVVISKPPAAAVMPALASAIAAVGKPVVVCCLGAARAAAPGTWVATLEDAAEAAAAIVRGRPWSARAFRDPAAIRARLAAHRATRGHVLGLYTGGTLAHEARLLLEPLLGSVASHTGGPATHRILDLGADEFTVGRPHPMLDPEARDARVREAGRSADVGVVLLDLVLGRGAHRDPARSLAAAVREARETAGHPLLAVASVVGTEADPQGLRAQVETLETAGIEVLPSNAQAARFAALALAPQLAAALLAGA